MTTLKIRVYNLNTGKVEDYEFETSPVRLGRKQKSNDVWLDDAVVSGSHGLIRFDHRGGSLEDLGSTNGTLLEGQFVTPNTPVTFTENLTVTIGHLEISLQLWHPQSTPSRSAILQKLQPRFREFEEARNQWEHAVNDALANVPAREREELRSSIEIEYPHAPSSSTGFDTLAGRSSIDAELICEFVRRTAPQLSSPDSDEDLQAIMLRVEDILRVGLRALIDLQAAFRFSQERLGVPGKSDGARRTPEKQTQWLLRYLLDWRANGKKRMRQLRGTFAELENHEAALIQGTLASVKSLLQSIDPREIEESVSVPWPGRGAASWRRYIDRYDALLADGDLHAIIFGLVFADAYLEEQR